MLNKYIGCIVGCAVGDAYGMPYEFKERGSFKSTGEMVSGGVFNLKKGYYTDDASQVLCLANSLIENDGEFNKHDFMKKLRDWYIDGYMSSTGDFIDIGTQTRIVLDQYDYDGSFVKMSDESQSGNGSLMRIAPIPLVFSFEDIEKYAIASSDVTHSSQTCFDCCVKYSHLIKHALNGVSKDDLKKLSQFNLEDGDFGSSGYVLDSYDTALYSFFNTDNFKDSIIMATEFGSDTDTNACITGMLSGAYYGVENIPESWKKDLKDYDLFVRTAEQLYFIKD